MRRRRVSEKEDWLLLNVPDVLSENQEQLRRFGEVFKFQRRTLVYGSLNVFFQLPGFCGVLALICDVFTVVFGNHFVILFSMKKTVKKAVSKKATVKRKAIHKKPVRGSYEAVMDAIEFAQKSGLAETYGR